MTYSFGQQSDKLQTSEVGSMTCPMTREGQINLAFKKLLSFVNFVSIGAFSSKLGPLFSLSTSTV